MKRNLLLLLVATLFATISLPAYAEEEDDDNQSPSTPPADTQTPPKPIVFDKPIQFPDPDPGKINPRGLAPISGLYADGVLMIDFAENLGNVSVTVVNTTTGEMWFESDDSALGTISIAITPYPGNYFVTVETQTDGVYIGEFIL